MKEKQGTINTEKRGMDERRLIERIAELERRLKEVEAENIVLRELAYQSEQRYEQIKQLMKENDELRRQLQQLPQLEATGDVDKEERPDSWFFHTLRQENAIAPRPERSNKK
ncbi:spore coat protein regulator protein YlbO [Geobacillus sp. 46C-IIa]|uniref:spore coat protein regulator protein YlbO n=1 Tax=Geobacillus sp. 46C-IIa TaxID=1963025 RepID=UPI00117A2337|nr:spore coat protein regulator protein YlbO [Geobacillus sp. 46C-IIa]QNU27172.1 spore coat protein regulator protein YlbO [Geobacillus sp. 46C-IIa]